MHPPKGIRRAISNELTSQGLHTANKKIVAALADRGVVVDEDTVQRVKIELLKDRTDVRRIAGEQKTLKHPKHRPPKIPQKRPRRK